VDGLDNPRQLARRLDKASVLDGLRYGRAVGVG
jgi:hypothetical protein